MLSIYINLTLEVLSIVAVLVLFTNIKTKERENLRLIARVYLFELLLVS